MSSFQVQVVLPRIKFEQPREILLYSFVRDVFTGLRLINVLMAPTWSTTTVCMGRIKEPFETKYKRVEKPGQLTSREAPKSGCEL